LLGFVQIPLLPVVVAALVESVEAAVLDSLFANLLLVVEHVDLGLRRWFDRSREQ
jgi:hypothetical protein